MLVFMGSIGAASAHGIQLMTSSSGFKDKNGLHRLARARTNMKNTKEIVYHCYNSCGMFAQFDELLRTLLITTTPYHPTPNATSFFYHI